MKILKYILVFAAALFSEGTLHAELRKEVLAYDEVDQYPSRDGSLILSTRFNRFPPIANVAVRKRENLAGLILDSRSGAKISDIWKYADRFHVHNAKGGLNCTGKAWPNDRLLQVSWSPDNAYVAFAVESGPAIHIWLSDTTSCRVHKLSSYPVRLIVDSNVYFRWSGPKSLLALTNDRAAGPQRGKAAWPRIYTAGGKASKRRFYRGLLENADDQKKFLQILSTRLVSLGVDGQVQLLDAEPKLYASILASPDGRYASVSFWNSPVPLHTPIALMSQEFGVIDIEAARRVSSVSAFVPLPLTPVARAEEHFAWQGGKPHSFSWWEADRSVDGSVITTVHIWDAGARKRSLLTKVGGLLEALAWRSSGEPVVLSRDPARGLQLILRDGRTFSLGSLNFLTFAYGVGVNGEPILAEEDERVLINHTLRSAEGPLEALDQLDLRSGELKRVWTTQRGRSESFLGLQSGSLRRLLIQSESNGNPPAVFVRDQAEDSQLLLSPGEVAHKEDIPERIALHYQRSDGIPLSADLFLPRARRKDGRPSLVVVAYPVYRSQADGSASRNTPLSRFERIHLDNPLSLVLDGFAVLENVSMPVIVDEKSGADAIIAQLNENLKLAVEAAVKTGRIEAKAAIFGHSFGANMAVLSLANSQLFRCGIAINGSYNRTLMPFGFQDVKRSYWEDQGLYLGLSPQLQAEKITAPLLLIHGEADDNPATLPIQSDIMFHTLNSLGKNARLVLFPHEDHFFRSRETVSASHLEQLTWLKECLKGDAQ